eukprot:2015558-Alexandrium_andersonii.AAC.1
MHLLHGKGVPGTEPPASPPPTARHASRSPRRIPDSRDGRRHGLMGSRGPNRFGDTLQVGAAGPTPPFPLLGADLDQRQAELDAQFNATVGAGHP